MVDHSAVGRRGRPFRMSIEKGKILEFAEATQLDLTYYRDSDKPVVPPTFLTTMMFWEKREEDSNPWQHVKMDPKRGMHGEQEYVFFGPLPRAGDVLTCQSRIESIVEKEGKKGGTLTFVDLVTEFRDESGTCIAEARMRAVETSQPPEKEGA